MRTSPLFVGLFAVVLILACASPSKIPNPLVRVDFRSELSRADLKKLPAAIDLDCHQAVSLGSGDVEQKFVMNWRVADMSNKRYIVAVDVAPIIEGKLVAGSSAQATVGKPYEMKGKKGIYQLSITIAYQVQSGCSHIKQTKTLSVRSDHKSCKNNQPKDLLKKK
jgi:hypothetical protein